jgi:hypothetical protein
MRERPRTSPRLVADPQRSSTSAGLKGMEAGVLDALRDIADAHGLDWPTLWSRLKSEGRLHFETY